MSAESQRSNKVNLELQPRQAEAFLTGATEVLYGGAAFGGKSHLMRVAAIAWCVEIPGLQVYLFRRTYPELMKNHMEGPSSFRELLAPWIESKAARIVESERPRIEIGKSRIHLCYCEQEKHVTRYQGAEIHVLMVDELTQWTETMYRYLRGRCRVVGLELTEEQRKRFPRVVASSNPGGVGHNWVKSTFIEPRPARTIWRVEPKEGGMLRQFLPARMDDNPIGQAADPDYGDKLDGLGNPALVRAMKDGDWDIVAGGAFDDILTAEGKSKIVLAPFAIPDGWRIDRSFDWGSSRPFSVGWWAESNGEAVEVKPGEKRVYPKGTLFRIAELYGWNGRPNEGQKLVAAEVAKQILEIERSTVDLRGRVVPGPADPSIFAMEDGHSIAKSMAEAGVKWLPADAGPGSRKGGFEALRGRLKASLQFPMEKPGLFVFDRCAQWLRTVPTLPRDASKVDDVDTEAEDHVYDETRYRVSWKPAGAGALSTVGIIGV